MPLRMSADPSKKQDSDAEVLALCRGMWQVTEVLSGLLSSEETPPRLSPVPPGHYLSLHQSHNL